MFMELDLLTIIEKPHWRTILEEIVTTENFDPWDIDVSKLVERYLEYIKAMKENNLKIPANILLAASILLRIKAYTWKLFSEKEEVKEVFVITEIPELPSPFMRITKKKITFEELVKVIEDIMKKEKRKSVQETIEFEIPEHIVEMVQEDEDFEIKIEETLRRIKETVDEENMTTFTNILPEKSINAFLDTFIPLLHLANKKVINVWQEKIFGEIFIALN